LYSGVAIVLFSLSDPANVGDGVGIDLANAVIDRIVSAEKIWNLEIAVFAVFDALSMQEK
jgi:hypothetical protein